MKIRSLTTFVFMAISLKASFARLQLQPDNSRNKNKTLTVSPQNLKSNLLVLEANKKNEQNHLLTQFEQSRKQAVYQSWGMVDNIKGSINISKAWENFKFKKNVTVAVIDTGIDFNHPYLKENIYLPKMAVGPKAFGKDFSTKIPSDTPHDFLGHGTHVSSIIKSTFPIVKLIPIKYYNPNDTGPQNLASSIKALEYAVNLGVDVINYSGGGPEPSEDEFRILKKALDKKIIIVAAAGNNHANIDEISNAYYPASYGLPNIISVAAHDENGYLISSSNWGKNSVDVSAPGIKIQAAIHNNSSGVLTGTSQATAFVTGVVAMIKSQFPNLHSEHIKNIIIKSSIQLETLKKAVMVKDDTKSDSAKTNFVLNKTPKLKFKEIAEYALSGGKLDAYQALLAAEQVHKKLVESASGQKRELAQKEEYNLKKK